MGAKRGADVAPTELQERDGKGRVKDKKSEYGEPTKYDPSFNGPIKNRSCTDVICCLLFLICFAGMLGVAALGFARGDPIKLLYPTDSSGNLCGTGNYASKPNLFFFDLVDCAKMGVAVIATGCPTQQVCVTSCPSTNWAWYSSYITGDAAARANMICKDGVDAVTSSKVCINKCPEENWHWLAASIAERTSPLLSKLTRDKMICKPNIDPMTSSKTVQQLVEDEDCAAYYVASSPVVGRCIPSIFSTILNKTASLASSDGSAIRDKLNQTVSGTQLEDGSKYLAYILSAKEYGVQVFQDVRAAWWMILVGLGVAMILAFIWIIIMRWLAGPMVFFSIVAFLGLFGFATYYCIMKYIDMKDNPANQLNGTVEFTTNLSYYSNLAYTWLIFGSIAGVVLLLVVIILIFLRSRILIAIALIKESSRAVGSMIFSLFFPMIPFVLEVILFGFWGASAVYLASSGSATYSAFNKTSTNVTVNGITSVQESINDISSQIPCDSITAANSTLSSLNGFCNFVAYGGDEYTIYLQFFQLFMFFWCMNFIVALGQMTLAGAFASYYWAWNKKKDIPMFPVSAGLWRSLRYHLGTLAFGSLIVAIIQIIRVMLEYVDHKLKGSENAVAKFFLKCLKCCFWCLEKFIKFLNKNAYILTAIYGKNFCISAKNAFFLILRNIVRVAVVDKVTDFLLFIGKLVVVGAVGTLGYLFFSGAGVALAAQVSASAANTISNYVPSLNFYLMPVIIICIGSYIIAAAFFSVYGMAVDTLFLCFLEDLERHDGSDEKPYYMSKELMGILGKKNKREENKE